MLISSHNPALLDALPHESIPAVTCCYRDPQTGESKLIRLEEVPTYPELIAQGPLGFLVTRGILDRHLKGRLPGRDEKLQALRSLLEGEEAP